VDGLVRCGARIEDRDVAYRATAGVMPDIGSLNLFDWLLLGVVAYSTITAFVRGFFREAFSLAGLIAGILLASWNYTLVGTWLARWIPWTTAQIVAFLAIGITVMVVFGIAGKLLHSTAKTIGLGFVDRMIGAIFGVVRGCLMGVAILMVAAAFLPKARFIRESSLSGYFLAGAHAVSFVLPTNLQAHIREGSLQLQHNAPDWIKRSR
jgi:membrane protein required for colicin V production